MSTVILPATSSSQELCQKTQFTRRRRRDLDPEGPAHLNRQDRAGELSQTVIYLQMALAARTIQLANVSYLPGVTYRSWLQLLSLKASPSSASSSPTAAFKQTSQNRLRRLTPPHNNLVA